MLLQLVVVVTLFLVVNSGDNICVSVQVRGMNLGLTDLRFGRPIIHVGMSGSHSTVAWLSCTLILYD